LINFKETLKFFKVCKNPVLYCLCSEELYFWAEDRIVSDPCNGGSHHHVSCRDAHGGMMILLFSALIATLFVNGLVVFLFVRAISNLNKLHYEEKSEIFNRFMAGDYSAYRYFKDEQPVVVDDMKKRMEKERSKTKTGAEVEKEQMARGF